MAVPYYSVGTATLTAGSAAMVGQGTLWSGNVRPGDTVVSYSGQTAIVGSVNSNTSITLTRPFRGASQTAAAYEIMFAPADAAVAQDLSNVMNAIRSSALVGLGGVAPSPRKLPYFDETGAANLATLTDAARTLLGGNFLKNDNYAPLHVGDRDVSNSNSAMVLVSRTVTTGTGSANAFSDSSLFARGGGYAYISFDARCEVGGTGNYANYIGFRSYPTLNTTGTISDSFGFYTSLSIGAGSVAGHYAFYVGNPTGAGLLANNYGIYIAGLTKGTAKNYAVYTEGSTPSFFGSMPEVVTEGRKIIDSGSNERGRYARFSDGTQICWMPDLLFGPVSTADGGFYRGASVGVSYPAAFSSAYVSGVVNDQQSTSIFGSFTPYSITSGQMQLWSPVSVVTNRRTNIIVIGRWL